MKGIKGAIACDVKKIAVLRANGLGDFIFVLPALSALRNKFPDAEIVYLGKQWHTSFLSKRPGPVDRVITIPKCNGIPNEQDRVENVTEVKRFFAEMKNEKFDIAFQMHGGGRFSNPFILELNAKLSVGLKTADAVPLDINVHYFLYQHEVLRYLEVVSRIGAQTKSIEPLLKVTKADKEELHLLIPYFDGPYAVLHPGASDIRRRWPPEKFAAVGDVLALKGFNVFISGTGSEGILAEKVLSAMKEKGYNISNRLSVNAYAALLSLASVVVSNDSGPLHLARAVGAPTVGVYWCGNIITAGPLTMDRNRSCISWNMLCPLCGLDCTKQDFKKANGTCTHEVSFVSDVSENEVIENLISIL
jgi:ADP-heptose:LPS heptosyltransferase